MTRETDIFIDRLLEAANAAGIETAEVFCTSSDSFSATAMAGKIDSYEVSTSIGLSLRGSVNGRMGYAASEAFDDEAIEMLVEGVKESAALAEAEDQDEIFAGEKEYPVLEEPASDIDEVKAEEKLSLCLRAEKAALAADPRIVKTEGATVSTGSSSVRIKNSFGLDLTKNSKYYAAYVAPIAKDGESANTGFHVEAGRKLKEMNPETLGKEAAEKVISQLHAAPVASGTYRVILRYDAMRSMLATFSGIFSAENAQQKMSLLAGREGQTIAAACVTLMDDPLLPDGFASAAFDAEGSASKTKAIIDHGVLTTLLHNRKTARKQGVQTTGNASKAGFAGPIRVAPTNFFIRPGEQSLNEMEQALGNGLLITNVSGLHAGANAISGDFSLLSKGFVIRDGKTAEPVEQITIAGNFYDLLKNIKAIASDLDFRGSGIGCPSVDVGELSVSGS